MGLLAGFRNTVKSFPAFLLVFLVNSMIVGNMGRLFCRRLHSFLQARNLSGSCLLVLLFVLIRRILVCLMCLLLC